MRTGSPISSIAIASNKTKYIDIIGTELADVKLVSRETIGFLAFFSTALTLQSDWLDTGHGTRANRRPVVLIVEDDLLSRMSAADMIVDAGYDVVEVGNADEAIAILKARSDMEIIFTDIQMPGSMDGLRLAKYVKRKWPPIKNVATSGRFAIREGDLSDGGVFLSKPDATGDPRNRCARRRTRRNYSAARGLA
jgi:CheY-like chemotaxis protein